MICLMSVHQTFPSLVWEEFVTMVRRGFKTLRMRRFRYLRWLVTFSLAFALGTAGATLEWTLEKFSEPLFVMELTLLAGTFVPFLFAFGLGLIFLWGAASTIKDGLNTGRLEDGTRQHQASWGAVVMIGIVAFVGSFAVLALSMRVSLLIAAKLAIG